MTCHEWSQAVVPSAVLLASLAGSGHCALMCGGLVAVAANTAGQSVLYHLGRLASYLLLGAVSGWIGQRVVVRLPAEWSAALALVLGAAFVGLGVLSWQGRWHVAVPGSAAVNRWTARGLQEAQTSGSSARRAGFAGMIGFLSIFLPCGWLYSFVLAALSVSSPARGALLLFVFWLGTLPALVLSRWMIRSGYSSLGRYAPKLSSALLVSAGLWPLAARFWPMNGWRP